MTRPAASKTTAGTRGTKGAPSNRPAAPSTKPGPVGIKQSPVVRPAVPVADALPGTQGRRTSLLRRLSALQIALIVSVAAHAGLLLVRAVDPDGFKRMFEETPLEVVLVNARSSDAPEKAQAIAQANLAGGGEADKGRASSPLPPSALVAMGEANEEAHKQIEQLQEAQAQLLAVVRQEIAALPMPDPRREEGKPDNRAQEEKRRQLLQLLAEIEKRVNEENTRPKKRYVSPATREAVYALYYDGLRRKIEERGTRNFPEFKGRKLYGELTMNVTVDAQGRVVETEVVRSSRSDRLDRQAVAIVRAAAPFGPFTPAMRANADQLVVTSRFRFTRDENLETSLMATPP